MCDSGSFSTGLVLTQVSVGLLASAFIGTFAHGGKIPEVEAVPIARFAQAEEATLDTEEGAATRPQSAKESAYSLLRRRRPAQDSITIAVEENQARNMTFDF